MVRRLKERPDFSVNVPSSKFFVNKDVPGNNIKFMVSSCFLSYSSIGLKPNPDTHVLTSSGIAERTNIFTWKDFSICIKKKDIEDSNGYQFHNHKKELDCVCFHRKRKFGKGS
jgi:hypothetical protein